MNLYDSSMPMYAPLDPSMMGGYYQQSLIDPGQYQGGFDYNGWRCGIGNCTWENGDTYEGDWKDNLRHGGGKYVEKEKGFTYIGQWQMDLKHGRGKMICKNGNIIIGSWKKDLEEGLFSVQLDVNSEKEMVIFKDGMRIDLSFKRTYKDIGYYIMSFITMLLFYIGIL